VTRKRSATIAKLIKAVGGEMAHPILRPEILKHPYPISSYFIHISSYFIILPCSSHFIHIRIFQNMVEDPGDQKTWCISVATKVPGLSENMYPSLGPNDFDLWVKLREDMVELNRNSKHLPGCLF
jgi:hypothetical protein